MHDLVFFPHYYILGICLLSAITDVRNGRIYNAVTVPSILLGIVLLVFSGDRALVASSLAGFAVGIVPFGLAAHRGWIGAGDAKLFGAVGMIGGFSFLMDSLLNTFVLAGLYSVLLLTWQAVWLRPFRDLMAAGRLRLPTVPVEEQISPRKRQIRLGVFIFLGALLSLARILVTQGL